MIIKNIYCSENFEIEFRKIPKPIIGVALKKENIFRKNPLHPSLRLHELKGKLKENWSISITKKYRIIFKRMENGDILFISIGKHDIYKYL